ncbi:hypothetical protein FACS1894147_00550 [Spirochaetia bacterium]|nr:hypothetical protein FACS1894147_00550 [Spirochaetia bacterium]
MILKPGKPYHLAEIIIPSKYVEEGDYRLFGISKDGVTFFFNRRENNDKCVTVTSKQLEFINIQPIPDWLESSET